MQLLVAASLLVVVGGSVWAHRLWVRRRDRLAVEASEDALKHLLQCGERDQPATVASLAGALRLSPTHAGELLAGLAAEGLAAASGGRWELTPDGQARAVQIVRAHRIWESYLAEHTGLAPERWHAEADRREHRSSADEVEALAGRVSQTGFDPHGDPIPTAEGGLPSLRGEPLTDIEVGTVVRILHVEDEPPEAYAELVRLGLHPGLQIELLEREPGAVQVKADDRTLTLRDPLAEHLTVATVAESDSWPEWERLAALECGDTATIVGISHACRGPQRRRLLDLGFVPGTRIRAELESPAADPIAYRVRGAVIALHRDQAAQIRVRRDDPGEHEETA